MRSSSARRGMKVAMSFSLDSIRKDLPCVPPPPMGFKEKVTVCSFGFAQHKIPSAANCEDISRRRAQQQLTCKVTLPSVACAADTCSCKSRDWRQQHGWRLARIVYTLSRLSRGRHGGGPFGFLKYLF